MAQWSSGKQTGRVVLLQGMFLAVLLLLLPLPGETRNYKTAKVEKIIDGDTIVVKYKEQKVKVRLWGIDTPEYYQAYSKVAKKYTAQLVGNATVRLEVKDWDDYGRMVAIVTMGDKRLLNEELLKAGLAWVHIYYCKEVICDKWYGYERQARQKKIGLWRDKSPIAPWVWKRKNKRRH